MARDAAGGVDGDEVRSSIMTNHEMNAEPGRDEVQGNPRGMSDLVAAWMRPHAQLHAAVKAALAGPGDAVAAMLRREAEPVQGLGDRGAVVPV